MTLVNNNTQPKVWMNGQYLPASQDKASGDWYVVIDGKRIKVDKNDLFGMNSDLTEHPQHLVDYYDKLLAENTEKRNALETAGQYIKAQLKAAKGQYDTLMATLGVKKINEITDETKKVEAKKYYNNVSSLKFDKTRNSNAYYSACMSGFGYALERGEWQNQLNLAKSVMNG